MPNINPQQICIDALLAAGMDQKEAQGTCGNIPTEAGNPNGDDKGGPIVTNNL